jgi:cellulase/cellobiase CelA1
MLPDQERRGILTLGATMLAHARSNDSSPVHRGKLVRERLLCQQLPPPPPGIVIQPPPLDPSKTTRERYAAHSSVEPCLTCHRLMDPIGLTFEHFDGIGRYRATDNGLPIDAHGEILGSPSSDGKFEGVSQLIDQLDGSPDVEKCFSLSWLRFAYGLSESGESQCAVQRMQQELADDAGSLGTIVSVLTQTLSFYERTGDPTGPAQLMAIEVEPADMPPPAPGATQAQPGLDVQISQSNDWGGGYCKTYQLKNTGAAAITWSVPLIVDGKLNNHWECEVSGDSGTVTFSGAQHNATLQPGAMAQFGFCAMR